MSLTWRTASLAQVAPVESPGGAEIRELPDFPAGRLSHATFAAGGVSVPAALTGVTEIFFILEGSGSLWLMHDRAQRVVDLVPDRGVVVPADVQFQYRAGPDGVRFLVATMPRWQPDVWSQANHPRWNADGSEAGDPPTDAAGQQEPWSVVDLPREAVAVAPDGSDVRPLLRAPDDRGSLAEFRLGLGATSKAVRHYDLEEIWFFIEGSGEMWREGGDPITVGSGTAVTIPSDIAFQFRNLGNCPLRIVGLTLPAWPLDRPESDVVDVNVTGCWAV
jgi:mannose-6-phosphate isomerase-like protein (cupin superfamily)